MLPKKNKKASEMRSYPPSVANDRLPFMFDLRVIGDLAVARVALGPMRSRLLFEHSEPESASPPFCRGVLGS